MQHSRQFLLDSYRSMATIRRFEDRVHDEFAGGKIPGFVHLYAGEEASAVGVSASTALQTSPPSGPTCTDR